MRPKGRRLTENGQQRAVELWDSAAEGNAVVVQALLGQEGLEASVRTVQRAVERSRRQVHAAQVCTVRFETKPGRQMTSTRRPQGVVIPAAQPRRQLS
ncbi:hypothetical protein [Corallococcus sp. 4LFB]|uniref:hypothetical protein n=1 Tax=Corallococcus sp. 4LFB TaxID=3383249 RepID=UPI00397677E8